MDDQEELTIPFILTTPVKLLFLRSFNYPVNGSNDRDNDNGDDNEDNTMNVYRLIDDILYLIATRY